MTQDKAPDWAVKKAGTLALDYVDWLGRDKVDGDAEHVLTNVVSLALIQAYERGQESMRERAAVAADEREAICADAVAKIEAGELYVGIATAKATEECARLEAAHIARLIRSLPIEQDSEVKG